MITEAKRRDNGNFIKLFNYGTTVVNSERTAYGFQYFSARNVFKFENPFSIQAL